MLGQDTGGHRLAKEELADINFTEMRSRIGRGIHKSVSREVISRDNLLRTKGPSIAIKSTKLMDRVLKLVALVLIAAKCRY